jgi:hypothetical protein
LETVKLFHANAALFGSADVINVCNLHCTHCYWWLNRKSDGVNDLEIKKAELQKTTTELQHYLAELQENDAYNDNLNPEVKQQNIISTDDILMPQQENAIFYHLNENGIFPHHSRVKPSSRTLLFDTKDLF